jgi:hypothetical protein
MKLFLIATLSLLSAFAMANQDTVLKETKISTFLRNLDGKLVVTCIQGNSPNTHAYPTPSILIVNSAALSVPGEFKNTPSYASYSKKMGYPCSKFLKDFANHKNASGTIPVVATVTYSKSAQPEYDSYATVDERGENTGTKSVAYDVLSETVKFSVGDLEFQGGKYFYVLK